MFRSRVCMREGERERRSAREKTLTEKRTTNNSGNRESNDFGRLFIDSRRYVDVFEAQVIANVYLSRTQNAGSESTNYFGARTSRPTRIDPSRVCWDPSTDPALINIHYPASRDQPSRYWQPRWFVQDSKDRKGGKWERLCASVSTTMRLCDYKRDFTTHSRASPWEGISSYEKLRGFQHEVYRARETNNADVVFPHRRSRAGDRYRRATSPNTH